MSQPFWNYHADKTSQSVGVAPPHDTGGLWHLRVTQGPWFQAIGPNVLCFLWMSPPLPSPPCLHHTNPKLSFQPFRKLSGASGTIFFWPQKKNKTWKLIIAMGRHNESTRPAWVWWEDTPGHTNAEVDRAQRQCYLNIMIVVNIYFMLMIHWVK